MTSFEAYRTQIWQFILARGVPPADADDIFQETWIGCWRADQGQNNQAALFFGIARNKVADYWRKRGTQRVNDNLEELPGGPIDEWRSLQNQIHNLFRNSQLNEDQANALILHHLLGYSSRECAHIMEVAEETVRSRLKLARKKLRKSRRREALFNPNAKVKA